MDLHQKRILKRKEFPKRGDDFQAWSEEKGS